MIIRAQRSATFTVINNDLINDPSLDWKELGLLIYLLSKPDYWEISPTHLANQRKTSINGVYAILKRLRNSGYVVLKRFSSGKTDWLVYDTPQIPPHHENDDEGVSHHKKPYEENTHEEKKAQVKTDKTVITEKTTTDGEDDFLKKVFFESEKKAAKETLKDLPSEKQKEIVAVLSTYLNKGAIKNKIAYLKTLVGKAEDGTFIANSKPSKAPKKKQLEVWEKMGFKSEKEHHNHQYQQSMEKYGYKPT